MKQARRTWGYRRGDPQIVSRKDDDFSADVFVSVLGRTFGSMISGRGYSTSATNESCAYIIESLVRDELGVVAGLVDTASFDAVGTPIGKRPQASWKYGRWIGAQQDALDYIGSLCQESQIVSLRDTQNRERVIALDYYEPAATLTTNDIAWEAGRPLVRVNQTHLSNVRNEFYLNYRFNYGTGEYDRQMFINATTTNMSDNLRPNDDGSGATYTDLCATSQTTYNKVERWTFDAQWIRDDGTAELLLKSVANWLAIRRWQVRATLLYSANTLKLELMDSVLWVLDLLPATVSNVNTFFITRLIDGGMANKFKMDVEFSMCPTVWGVSSGAGYGYSYGETYGSNL